jgi:hypothetical protein
MCTQEVNSLILACVCVIRDLFVISALQLEDYYHVWNTCELRLTKIIEIYAIFWEYFKNLFYSIKIRKCNLGVPKWLVIAVVFLNILNTRGLTSPLGLPLHYQQSPEWQWIKMKYLEIFLTILNLMPLPLCFWHVFSHQCGFWFTLV